MKLEGITHIVLYRPYRAPKESPLETALFTDAREALDFAGSHGRYCSHMSTCKVDIELTDDILAALTKGAIV